MRKTILAVMVATSIPALAAAQADSTIWITEPRWSSDGRSLLFAAGTSGKLSVFAVEADGSSLRRLACGDSSAGLPDWSHDKRFVAIDSRRDGTNGVYKLETATGVVTRVSPPGLRAQRGKWSTDGSRIAFTVVDTGRIKNVWTARADGMDARPLTTGAHRYEALAWAPDGRRLLVSSADGPNTQLFLLAADGSAMSPLLPAMPGTVYGGAWSHDGSRIAFDLDDGKQSDIHVVAADGTGLRNVTNHPARDYGGEWSADDARLLIFSTRERRRYHFYEVTVSDGATKRLTAPDNWSPDARCAGAPAQTLSVDATVVADQLLAIDRGFAAAAAGTDLVAALSRMFADDVIMGAPAGHMKGRDAAIAALRSNPDNPTSRVHWIPIRAGLSSDGRHGFTQGYITTTKANGDKVEGKYLAYWIHGDAGWRVAVYKRAPRPPGEVSTRMIAASLPTPGLPSADAATMRRFELELRRSENEFSADAMPLGPVAAFRKWGSTDAVVLGGGAEWAVGVEAVAAGAGTLGPTETLTWWPEEVIVAATGDLGVSIGYIRRGVRAGDPAATAARNFPFFTIWKRATPRDPWRYVAE